MSLFPPEFLEPLADPEALFYHLSHLPQIFLENPVGLLTPFLLVSLERLVFPASSVDLADLLNSLNSNGNYTHFCRNSNPCNCSYIFFLTYAPFPYPYNNLGISVPIFHYMVYDKKSVRFLTRIGFINNKSYS